MNVKVIGIDLAKNVFQVCVQLEDGTIQWNRKIKRDKLLHVLRQFPEGTLIAMEACGSAHHWGRTFESMGFQVKLIPAQHVKPLARRQKNDANDALAICEAAFRPNIHTVPIKSVAQQDIQALRRIRQRKVAQRTATANQLRGLALEYGVALPVGIKALQTKLPDVLEDAENGLSPVIREQLQGLKDDVRWLSHDIAILTEQKRQLCQQLPRYQALLGIPGYGPILTAALLGEVGDGHQFRNGRHLSAWTGVVPRQHSSGGIAKLGAITKNGNRELRTLLIHGARAVIRHVDKRQDPMGRWLKALIARRGKVKAIVALANKLARIGWRILTGTEPFDMAKAFGNVH